MKKRNPLAVLILSLVTFGIYDIYWLVSVKSVLNKQTRTKVPSIWWVFAPVLMLVAFFVAMIILFAVIGATHPNGSQGGSASAGAAAALALLPLVAMLLTFVAMYLVLFWFWKFSKAVGEYTNGKMSTGVTFLLLFLLRFVGIAIIQDELNDMIDYGPAAMGAPVAQPYAYGAPIPPAAPSAMPAQPPTYPVDPTQHPQA